MVAQAPAAAYTPVGTVSQLNRAGFLVNDHTPLGSVMVVRDQANQIKAVSPVCTHQGCRVDWQAGQGEFYCPCHGARFAAGGTVLAGPARADLPTFSTRIDNGNVLVSRANTTASTQTSESPYGAEAYGAEADDETESGDREEDGDREENDDHRSLGQPASVNA
jgi:cytochrome b6-f complex iron-sulfur subunit